MYKRQDVAALNMGSMNYAKYSARRKDFVFKAVFENSFDTIIAFLEAMNELGRRVLGELGGYARLDRVYITPAMPKTRTGKTMRRLLRDLVVHGKPNGDTSAMEDASALDVVAAAVKG